MSVQEFAKPILDGVYRLRNAEGQDASYAFQVPPSQKLVDYYQVIKRPMALDMIRKSLRQKKYTKFSDFIRDLCQIVYNARLYNPPESFIYQDALVIDKYIKSELAKLRKTNKLDESELVYPEIGPLPTPPEPAPQSNADSSESDSDSEPELNSGAGRRRRPVRMSVLNSRTKHLRGDSDDEDGPRKRGRPPTVDKPHEHRIKAILRAIRRERDPHDGRALHTEFDKLPDKVLLPHYYQEIQNPIALDIIKKKIKRRAYNTLDEFMADVNLMVSNCKQFNPPESLIYADAEALEAVALATAKEEAAKDDSVYGEAQDTARTPLDSVQHRGETYSVGDWVHIENPNDPAKPIIGQIFRLWQSEGKQFANCCWYYRPEQTVHLYTKCFYENEVVKSGQYRDHTVEQILEKCFVMFITKYQRGRPTGIGQRTVYCCESRYNETDRQLTKIRTWKACIPDEIRSGDYPMDLFERPAPLKRLASPIKHLLPADAKDNDPIPSPKMGSPNAPPIVGAVFKRPADPNDPPETPTVPEPAKVAPSQASSPYARTPVPQAYTQLNAPPVAIQTAFSLPHPFVAGLRQDQLQNVARGKDGQPLWFPACPIWISHRYHSDPLDTQQQGFGDQRQGLVAPKGFGHSAKYLAWKAKQRTAAR